MWATATRLALVLTPILEINAVAQVPMFIPIIVGTAIPIEILPVNDKACKIPTAAAELWIIPVKIVPTATPKSGLVNAKKK